MDDAMQSSPDVTNVSSGVDTIPLDFGEHLFDVQSELVDVASNWKNIGIALRLKPDFLQSIDTRYSGDSRACLTWMVMEWLMRNYDVQRFGEPTWQQLVEAVGHPAGGANMAHARKIARRHKAGVPRLSVVTQTQQTPPSPQGEAEMQMSPHPSHSTLQPQRMTSSPHLLPQTHSACQKLSKAAGFTHENRQAITAKFADFQTKVCNKLSNNGVDIEKFRLFVINQFPPGDCIPPSPTSVTEIFEAITHHRLWDYFHYSPLAHIANTFGANDRDMEGWVQTYKQDLKAYQLVTTVEDYIEADLDITDTTPPNRARCDPRYYTPVEWKTKFMDHSLQYLAEVWELFSSHYLMPDYPPTALLHRVRRGCFTVTWLIPSGLILSLVEGIKIDPNFLQQHHILRVTVGEKKCVYEAKESQLQLTASEQIYAQRQQNLQEKEKMILELMKENQQLRHELDKVSQRPTQKGKLSFEMCDSFAPRAMHRGSATVCGNMAYFRPGFAENGEVLSYNSDTKEWSTQLPVCPRDRFTLTVINGLVTAVGGRQSNQYTNTLLSLMEEGGKKWVEYFKRMPTERCYTAVVCSGKALVVAGGEGEKDAVQTTVEVMDTDTQQWSTASSLPQPLTQASATVCGDKVYLLGGRDKQGGLTASVFTCSLNILLQQNVEAKTKTLSPDGNHSQWDTIADDLQVFTSTCATLNGQLLAVGGYNSHNKWATNNIYTYNTKRNEWEVISQMHTPRSWCLVTVLPGNKLMVVGGEIDTPESENKYKDTDKVEIATLRV